MYYKIEVTKWFSPNYTAIIDVSNPDELQYFDGEWSILPAIPNGAVLIDKKELQSIVASLIKG